MLPPALLAAYADAAFAMRDAAQPAMPFLATTVRVIFAALRR